MFVFTTQSFTFFFSFHLVLSELSSDRHNFRIPLHTTMTCCSRGYSYGSRIPRSKRNVSGKVELNSIDGHNFRIQDDTKDH